MRNLLKNKYFYILSGVFLVVGVAIGLPFSIKGFSFTWKIELFDIFSLFVTIGLAIYVAASLKRQIQDDRIEKELHIEQINQIEQILSEIENVLRQDKIQYNGIVSRISKIRIKKNNIFSALQECIPEYVSTFNEKTNSISQDIEALKRLLTDTSVGSNPDVVMTDGMLKYSIARLSNINKAIYGLENDLYRLKITLNRI